MEVGDLVRYKSKTLESPNPVVLVVKVTPSPIESIVSVVDPSNGKRSGRFAKQLEIVSASR